MKNFGEKEVWAYPGTAQFWGVPPIISATGKATDFKFGQYVLFYHAVQYSCEYSVRSLLTISPSPQTL